MVVSSGSGVVVGGQVILAARGGGRATSRPRLGLWHNEWSVLAPSAPSPSCACPPTQTWSQGRPRSRPGLLEGPPCMVIHRLGSRHPTHLSQMPSQACLPVTRLLPLRALHQTPRATESFVEEERGHPKGP